MKFPLISVIASKVFFFFSIFPHSLPSCCPRLPPFTPMPCFHSYFHLMLLYSYYELCPLTCSGSKSILNQWILLTVGGTPSSYVTCIKLFPLPALGVSNTGIAGLWAIESKLLDGAVSAVKIINRGMRWENNEWWTGKNLKGGDLDLSSLQQPSCWCGCHLKAWVTFRLE
jgi:hypothetical protein